MAEIIIVSFIVCAALAWAPRSAYLTVTGRREGGACGEGCTACAERHPGDGGGIDDAHR